MRKISYNHAMAVVRNYQRREAEAAATGRRANKSSEVKDCEAYLETIYADDHRAVDEVIQALMKGRSVKRTQRRLDAFERTKTPLPREWAGEPEIGAPKLEAPRSSESAVSHVIEIDVSGLRNNQVTFVEGLARSYVDLLRSESQAA